MYLQILSKTLDSWELLNHTKIVAGTKYILIYGRCLFSRKCLILFPLDGNKLAQINIAEPTK